VLNRKALASIIFDSEANRLFVNNLIHPIVRADFDAWCATQDSPLVFNEAAILFETGAYRQFDATVLVIAPFETRIQRMMQRDRCTREQAEARIQSQWSDEQKIPLATWCISNDGVQPLLQPLEGIVRSLLNP
jgi:dephospho-CoA kinase